MMKVKTIIDQKLQLVRLTVSGNINIDEGKEMIRDARRNALKYGFNLLYDMRQATLDASVTDLYKLVWDGEVFDDPEMYKARVGILVKESKLADYQFYETTASNAGLTVKVMHEEAELIKWISQNDT